MRDAFGKSFRPYGCACGGKASFGDTSGGQMTAGQLLLSAGAPSGTLAPDVQKQVSAQATLQSWAQTGSEIFNLFGHKQNPVPATTANAVSTWNPAATAQAAVARAQRAAAKAAAATPPAPSSWVGPAVAIGGTAAVLTAILAAVMLMPGAKHARMAT